MGRFSDARVRPIPCSVTRTSISWTANWNAWGGCDTTSLKRERAQGEEARLSPARAGTSRPDEETAAAPSRDRAGSEPRSRFHHTHPVRFHPVGGAAGEPFLRRHWSFGWTRLERRRLSCRARPWSPL